MNILDENLPKNQRQLLTQTTKFGVLTRCRWEILIFRKVFEITLVRPPKGQFITRFQQNDFALKEQAPTVEIQLYLKTIVLGLVTLCVVEGFE